MSEDTFFQMFSPENWGTAEKFTKFASGTYSFDHNESVALEGVIGHLEKAFVLSRVARRLEDGFDLDMKEVRESGYSPAMHSKEFAAVVEEIFGELYSCLDCTRQVLKAAYPKAQGIPSKKTSTLFSNAADGKLAPTLPTDTIDALTDAQREWFPKLRKIRTAITHRSPGHCSKAEDGKIMYFNRALGRVGNSLEMDDVWDEINRYLDSVNTLVGAVFNDLNSTLMDERVHQFCGISGGRIYERLVSPKEASSFDDGVCKSRVWFEKEEEPTCPMADTCGAYKRSIQNTE